MFGRKAKEKPKERGERRRGDHLSQFGLMDVPGVDAMGNLDDMLDDDPDLEAELAQLVEGGGGARKPKARPKPVPNLDAMVADCMKDFASDEEMSDTEDPDLLAELHGLNDDGGVQETAVQPMRQQEPVYAGDSYLAIIQTRIGMYREAEEVAKFNGESSKARRCNRGLKTLLDLEKAVKAGRPVREDDIPPQISIGKKKEPELPAEEASPSADDSPPSEEPRSRPAPPPPARTPAPPPPSRDSAPPPPPSARAPATPPPTHSTPPMPVRKDTPEDMISVIERRRGELKHLALAAKSNGDKPIAIEYMKRIKICDQLKEALQQGEDVQVSMLPETSLTTTASPVGGSAPAPATRSFSRDDPIEVPKAEEEIPPPNPELFGAPPPPKTIKEALTQRLEKYKSEEAKAKEAGNGSKARRMGRIVKQYQDALKLHAAGRPIPRGELPDPPGFAPIPVNNTPPTASPAAVPVAAPAAAVEGSSPKPSAAQAAANDQSSGSPAKGAAAAAASVAAGMKVQRQSSMMSVQDKQLMALVKRQKLFKEAALQAKQQGQRDTAKEYLKQALSINKLIEVSKAGLPVDMTTLPVPPQMQVKTNMEFEIVSKEDCQITGDREEMYSKLEQDLIAQVKMCMSNRTYFKEVGDVSSANKFEQMAVHSKKDLDAVRFAFKRGEKVPKFHYETRAFSRVISFTELTDNDLELTVVSGINYVVKNPKDVDTYVRWEFPFPRDAPVIDKTAVIKDTNNPAYDAKFMLVVNPRDKTFQRVVKRSALKVEVWSKGGFLRSDTLVGTANVKLAPLETKCEIHDSFDLYDGRKPVGGKVEIRMRLRNPIVSKQIEQAQEKWLVVKF